MLYYLSHFSADFGGLNVFRYDTFRALMAALTSLLLSFAMGPRVILLLTRLKLGQPLRQKSEVRELADLHSGKKGTPTMGGILILATLTISSLLWCDPMNHLYWLVLGSMLYLSFIGFADDYEKVAKKNSKGIRGWQKLAAQFLLAIFVWCYLYRFSEYEGEFSSLYIPFLKTPLAVDMGIFTIIFFALVIMGASNAVNLTDGLDGLAIGISVSVFVTYAIFCYVAGNVRIAAYLLIQPVSGAGDLGVFCAALAGSGLGFLWFNAHPAQVFMGDTGSLSIGGVLGVIAICVHQELTLIIAGGVFVLEAASVLIQVASFKLTGKRVFLMSPLHHHFELKGWNETTVTVRFWIMGLLAALMALATLETEMTTYGPIRKKVVVIGLGISGMEAAKLLKDKGAQVTVRDNATTGKVAERADALRKLGMRVELGDEVQKNTDYDLGVLSPGINPKAPIVETLHQAGLPMFGELELAYRFCECPIVAITGTNGKTTTTELVEALLIAGGKRALASGNIGTAFSTAVRESANLDVMVLEVSSFQLENIVDFRPRISVHLNLTPDHLDRYATMEEYAFAKRQVFRNQTVDDYAVLNAALSLPGLMAQRVTFSAMGVPADYMLVDGWLCARGEQVLEQSKTHLIGEHNAENMLAALAVADLYQIPREISVQALCAYHPLPHRLEKVGEIGGAIYLNDSKATNIDALEKALIAMRTPCVLIAGGKDKGLDFTGLRPLLREKVRAVVLIGQMTGKMMAAWSSAVPCHPAETLADAVEQAHVLAHRGDTVLFSPGCSSYDMFKSFEDRGDQFRALVQTLAAAQPTS